MEAAELRINNWVFDSNNEPVQIQLIESDFHLAWQGEIEREWNIRITDNSNMYITESINPIPINEEWLKQFGFSSYGSDGQYFFNKEDFWSITYYSDSGKYIVGQLELELKHVHQLQNLYFAITQTELTLNHNPLNN